MEGTERNESESREFNGVRARLEGKGEGKKEEEGRRSDHHDDV